MTPRSCGDCHECCRTPAIPELGKPAGRACGHLLGADSPVGRCGIYGERPATCKAFRCLWLAGGLELRAQHRPDFCGVYLNWALPPDVASAYPEQVGIGPVACASVGPSGLKPPGKLLLARLESSMAVIVVQAGLAELRGPKAARDLALWVMQRHAPEGVTELSFNGGRVRWRVGQ